MREKDPQLSIFFLFKDTGWVQILLSVVKIWESWCYLDLVRFNTMENTTLKI